MLRHGCAIAIPSLLALSAVTAAGADSAEGVAFFESKIRPVLVKRCYECHSAESEEVGGKLLLDTRDGTRKGGESGQAVVPNDLEKSLLLNAIQYKTFEMPPDERLPDVVIADFIKWIEMGAPDPRSENGQPSESAADEDLWSLQPLAAAAPPSVNDQAWPTRDLDRFILQRLEAAELKPVVGAEPLTLLRRLHFDLAGLPPAAEDVDAFLADPSPQALAAVIDRLLESPHFGERWGRHWLDVVRYAESNGKDRDVLMPHAWRYRDYVIDALNADVPYDRFIQEQLAGDLLPAEDANERDRLNIATGMLAIGSKSLTGNLQMDLIDDQIDVVTRSVLGLTASCARCHDHKFDPIPTRDYYALAGIFRSTETLYGGGLRRSNGLAGKVGLLIPLGENADEQVKEVQSRQKETNQLQNQKKTLARRMQVLKKQLPKDWQARLKELQANPIPEDDDPFSENTIAATDKQILSYARAQDEVKRVDERLKELQKAVPIKIDFAVGVRDSRRIQDSRIHIRGERNQLGDAVPRGYLTCFELPGTPSVDRKESGRSQLAQWLTHSDNPLTARVAVNRIWSHLFGRGIVASVDNFGSTGEPPTHPELLDFLATRFINDGWSTKKLIREIVSSRTYQLSSTYDTKNYAADADNRLYWRMPRRRLEAESIRDALLTVSGVINLSRPEASAVARIGDGEWGRGIKTDALSAPFPHRSIYLPIIRGHVPEILKTFDFPEPSNVQGRRDITNVPSQSLFLMNNPFVIEQAEAFASRALGEASQPEERVSLLYKAAFGRYPEDTEIQRCADFVRQCAADQSPADQDELTIWKNVAHALLASAEFRYID